MYKKIFLMICIFFAILILLSLYLYNNSNNTLNKNTKELADILLINDKLNRKIQDLIKFDYEKIYVFSPYQPKKDMERTIGFKCSKLKRSLSEGMMNILFVNEKKAVAYLYGTGENSYYIDIPYGEHTREFLKIRIIPYDSINLSQASSNSSTSVDFYGVPSNHYNNDPTAPADWVGHAENFIGSTSENGLTKNWAYAIINMNVNEMNGSGLNSNQKAAAIAHEMGHAYGLLHYERAGTIMYPYINGMTVDKPSSIDRYAITLKY